MSALGTGLTIGGAVTVIGAVAAFTLVKRIGRNRTRMPPEPDAEFPPSTEPSTSSPDRRGRARSVAPAGPLAGPRPIILRVPAGTIPFPPPQRRGADLKWLSI